MRKGTTRCINDVSVKCADDFATPRGWVGEIKHYFSQRHILLLLLCEYSFNAHTQCITRCSNSTGMLKTYHRIPWRISNPRSSDSDADCH